MNVLITGITGMVGSHLADYLVANTDWKIYGLIRWRSSLENLSDHIQDANLRANPRLAFLYGDLGDDLSLRSAVAEAHPDIVFHLAAQSFPKTSFSSPISTLDTNLLGTYRLLQAINDIKPDTKVHVCSSSEVFGRVPAKFVPITEDCRFHPASPYAISKVGTDLIGRFFSEAFGLNTQTTRMFTHTGPRRGDVFAESTFAKQLAMIERGLIPPVIKVGNLDSLRTFADVRDAVRAYFMLMTSSSEPGSFYNIGGTHTCTVGVMLEKLISLSSNPTKIRVEVDPERLRPIDADLQIPDTSLFQSVTGWSPNITFDQTMEDLLNYWRAKIAAHGAHLTR